MYSKNCEENGGGYDLELSIISSCTDCAFSILCEVGTKFKVSIP